MAKLAQPIAMWMRQQVTAAGAHGLLVGLSGGVDSVVVARLCQLAMPGRALGVLLPCQNSPGDEADAYLGATHFQLPVVRIDLGTAHDALVGMLQEGLAGAGVEMRPQTAPDDQRARVSLGNVKPRLRMTSLYFLANSLKCLVAGTGNRSEVAIGYFTKYGDGGVDLLPLGGLLKSQVRALARELAVPPQIIEKVSSAGLWPGQTDEGEMGFTYRDLEAYLTKGPGAVAPALALRIERLMRASQHKRELPPVAPASGMDEDTGASSA